MRKGKTNKHHSRQCNGEWQKRILRENERLINTIIWFWSLHCFGRIEWQHLEVTGAQLQYWTAYIYVLVTCAKFTTDVDYWIWRPTEMIPYFLYWPYERDFFLFKILPLCRFNNCYRHTHTSNLWPIVQFSVDTQFITDCHEHKLHEVHWNHCDWQFSAINVTIDICLNT